jgi:hypothetical protein
LTRTLEPENWPFSLPSVVAGALGEVGDPSPPHAEATVASAAQQAPAQNSRLETTVFASDIVILVTGGQCCSSGTFGKIEAT